MKHVLALFLLVRTCSPEAGETYQPRWEDEHLRASYGIYVTDMDVEHIHCMRIVWGAKKAKVFLLNEEDWPINDAVGYTWWGARTRVLVRWDHLVTDFNRMWVLNHEFVHWSFGDGDHSRVPLWHEQSQQESLQWSQWLTYEECNRDSL